MRINRRKFIQGTLGLPLMGMVANSTTRKIRPTKVPKQEGHPLLLALRLFERQRVYPGELAEVILDRVPDGTPVGEIQRAVFTDPVDKHTRIPTKWHDDKLHCMIPRYEIAENDEDWREVVTKLNSRAEQDCRALLIEAGQYNIPMRGTPQELHTMMREQLGDDCVVFHGWRGAAPDFYKYTVGVKKVPDNLIMAVWEEPMLWMHGHTGVVFGWMEIGLAVANHKHICLGREINELRDSQELVPAIA